jgi:hypothetical protein
MRRRFAIAALFSLTLSACASMRGVEVRSDNAESYSINVYNTRNSSVSVSYEGGGASRELGTVASGETERFVVISSSPTITLFTRSSAGAALSSYTVSLTKSNPATVTIR